jgi:hypothetical protein
LAPPPERTRPTVGRGEDDEFAVWEKGTLGVKIARRKIYIRRCIFQDFIEI